MVRAVLVLPSMRSARGATVTIHPSGYVQRSRQAAKRHRRRLGYFIPKAEGRHPGQRTNIRGQSVPSTGVSGRWQWLQALRSASSARTTGGPVMRRMRLIAAAPRACPQRQRLLSVTEFTCWLRPQLAEFEATERRRRGFCWAGNARPCRRRQKRAVCTCLSPIWLAARRRR
jgi:hypothetical protein